MYDPDENDYERIQNNWNPEDPSIYLEELYATYGEDEFDDQEEKEEYYEDEEEGPAILVYESAEECQAKTKRDPFLKVIKAQQKRLKDTKLKEKYAEFIKQYDTPIKYDIPFFTNDVMDKVWKDRKGEMHSAYFCLDISPYYLYQLDPKLLIVYAPYFIKRFGFPNWYNPFVDDIDDKKTYIKFIQENCDKLKLNPIEIKIVRSSSKLSNHDDDYEYYDDEDDDSWWYHNEAYQIDETGHLEESPKYH